MKGARLKPVLQAWASAEPKYRMGFRGYRQDGKSFITWWNANTRQSVQAVTREGRIKRFERITEGSCSCP